MMDVTGAGGVPGAQTITLMKIGYYQIGPTLGKGTFGKVKCKYLSYCLISHKLAMLL